MTQPNFDQDFWEQLWAKTPGRALDAGCGHGVAALDPEGWERVVAGERRRAVAGTGVDAAIRAARRRT